MAIRLVLDTNVLVSALLTPEGNPAFVLDGCLEGRWEPAASPEVLEEYAGVFARARFKFPPALVKETLERLKAVAVMVAPSEPPRACSDPADDKFLAAALAARAEFLVTGNVRHFPRSPFRGVRIALPADFRRELSG